MGKNGGVVGRFALLWCAFACAFTLVCGLVYLTMQQELRQNANDPQVQMAEDASAALVAGQTAAALVPPARVDLGASLAPFLMIFSEQGQLVAGSAQLGGTPPAVPPGVFADVRRAGEERITWQPAPGVRVAAVIRHVGGAQPGFVLAGRSLREVEDRIDRIGQLAGAIWLAGLAAAGVGCAALAWVWRQPAL